MKSFVPAAVTLFCGMVCATTLAAQDAILADMIRPSAFSKDAFLQPVTLESTESQGKKTKTYTARYEPSAPIGQQWTLVSVNGVPAGPEAKARLASMLSKHEPPQTYSDIEKYIGRNPVVEGKDDSGILLRQTALAPKTVVVNDLDVSDQFQSLVHLNDKGNGKFVDWVEFSAKQPFKMGPASVSSAKGRMAFERKDETKPPRATSTSFNADIKMIFGGARISRAEVLRY